jgi:DNA polymerase III epsilon subunit-like protein
MQSSVYFDFETGGVKDDSPNIQLAAIAVDGDWTELGVFEEKIQFDEKTADPKAMAINHYDPLAWQASALRPCDVVKNFADFLEAFKCLTMTSRRTGRPYKVARLFGHNAASFDGPRLRTMFGLAGVFLPASMFIGDTLQRALWWFEERREQPESLKLTELCKYFGIDVDGAHDALKDVRLCIALSRALETRA